MFVLELEKKTIENFNLVSQEKRRAVFLYI